MHWANVSSAAVELADGMMYSGPLRDEAKFTADNPAENAEEARGKRIFMVVGTSRDPVKWFDESQGDGSPREATGVPGTSSAKVGIQYEWHEEPGGHIFREKCSAATCTA